MSMLVYSDHLELQDAVPDKLYVSEYGPQGNSTVAAVLAPILYDAPTHTISIMAGVPNGVATLNALGLIPNEQLPPISITDTYPVNSQAAMLALNAQRGDVAIRTDLGRTFILAGDDPTVLANWTVLPIPVDAVTSVNGRTGVVLGLAEDNTVVHNTGNETVNGTKTFQSPTVSTVGLIVKGLAAQSGDLQQWQDSTGVMLASVDAVGNFVFNTVTPGTLFGTIYRSGGSTFAWDRVIASTGEFRHEIGPATSWGGYHTFYTDTAERVRITSAGVGIGTLTPGAQLHVQSGSATTVASIVRGAASQSADLQQWQSSAGSVVANIGAGGTFYAATVYARDTTYHNAAMFATQFAGSAEIAIVAKAGAGATGDLQQWQNSSGTPLASVAPDGTANFAGFVGTQGFFTAKSALATPLLVKAFAAQTADLAQWQSSTGTVLARVNNNGEFAAATLTTGQGNIGQFGVGYGLGVVAPAAGSVAAIVRGAVSQTADLTQWKDSATNTVASLNATGGLFVGVQGGQRLSVNGAFTSTTASVLTAATSWIGLAVRGSASQTADLQQWQDSSAAILSRINSAGGGAFKNLVVATASAFFDPTTSVFTSAFIEPYSTGAKALVLRGTFGQTGNLQEWQNSAGTVLALIQSGGTFNTNSIYAGGLGSGATVGFKRAVGTLSWQWYSPDDPNLYLRDMINSRMAIQVFPNSGAGTLVTQFSDTVAVQGAAAQTNDLQQWKNSANAVLAKVDATGNFSVTQTGAAQDASIWATSAPTANASLVLASGHQWALSSRNSSSETSAFKLINQSVGMTYLTVTYQGGFTFGPTNTTTIPTTIIKAAVSQTNDLTQWQNSAGTVLTQVDASGSIYTPGKGAIAAGGPAAIGRLTSFAISASDIPIVAKGFASQTASLQEWQNSSGTMLTRVRAAGEIDTPAVFIGANLGANLSVTNANPANIMAILRGAASQTADLQQWQDSSGAVKASVASDGSIRSTAVVGTAHVAAATPTGGSSGDIKVGNGKIWVNDAGTWKSVAIA